jgi:ABC-type multidrug transport system fused ATPase/permease subunit
METIDGLATIKATRSQQNFINRYNTRMNNEQTVSYINMMLSKWTELFNRTLASFLFLIVAVVSVVSARDASAAAIGLSLGYMLSITDRLAYLFHVASNLAVNLTSFERILRYSNLPSEPYGDGDGDGDGGLKGERLVVGEEWPSKGVIEFKNFKTKYVSSSQNVLDDLSLKIEAGEKVGIGEYCEYV